MTKLFLTIVSIILCAIFFIQNMVKVPVRFIITEPIDIRLTYLLVTAFAAGYLLCIVKKIARTVKKNEERRLYEEELSSDLQDEI